MSNMFRECTRKKSAAVLVTLVVTILAVFRVFQVESEVKQSSEYDNSKFHMESDELKYLAKELSRKIDFAKTTRDLQNISLGCKGLGVVYPGECNQTNVGASCLQPTLPVGYESRINQLAFKDNLQISDLYRDVIQSLTEQIDGSYDVIFVSALSSNHFKESQVLIKTLHESVFPVITNYLLVMYNIGLIPEEKKQLQKHCRCTVLDFPFEKLPPHFRSLKCFAWKPFAISAVYPKAKVVIWADASIRFILPDAIPALILKTKRQGIVARYNPANAANPYYTLPQMFKYFGDSPCAHLPFVQVESGFEMFHWEPLIKKAVMDPWVACALSLECTCPVPQHTVQNCPRKRDPMKFGYCMRNDQSSLSIILAKLFREKYYHFAVRTEWFINVLRGDQLDYFKMLENSTIP